MSERVYAFTDEYGAFGWDIENPNTSTHFILTAVIVKEGDLDAFRAGAEEVRKRYFMNGEIKSSKIGNNHRRRLKIWNDLRPLPFLFFTVSIDKKICMENMNPRGREKKETFYKFMNNIVHKELRRAFKSVVIVADQLGSNKYMESFCLYVENHKEMPNLWGDTEFSFQNSKYDVGVQIADFISGTLARVIDTHKMSTDCPDYFNILSSKAIRIQRYPVTYKEYILEDSAIASDYDKPIAELCFAQAAKFLAQNEDEEDEEIQEQILVLKYLLFRFMNNDKRKYISTGELKDRLEIATGHRMTDRIFRTRIIGKLRDKGIIIASSSRGYIIPTRESELYDFVNHDASIIVPMLARLKKCRDLVKMGTLNQLDLLDHTEYQQLKRFLDSLPLDLQL